jgi:FixJ family two-component response regulator
VTDYAMPRQSGVELLERARALAPGLPGVIITGYADARSVARRPDDVVVLGKPFSGAQLDDAVRAATRDAQRVAAPAQR